MSLTITNQPTSLLFQLQTNDSTQNEPGQATIKDRVIEQLAVKEEQVYARIDEAVNSGNESLHEIEQFAVENGYERLARISDRASGAVSNAGQRATDYVEQRFDTAEQRIEQRPDGGYPTTPQDIEALIDRVSSNADTRISAMDARTTAVSDRLAGYEQLAIDKGYDGSHIAAYSDRVTDRMQQATSHYEARTDQVIDRMQNLLDNAYGNTADPSQDGEPIVV